MNSPACRHLMRQSAVEAAQRKNDPLRHANGYELMMLKLYEDIGGIDRHPHGDHHVAGSGRPICAG